MKPTPLGVASASVLALVAACHAEGGSLNSSFVAAGSGYESRSENRTTASGPNTPVPAVPPEPAPAASSAAPAPTAPPADACPLQCHEARGPVSAPLTVEETAQLRTALEPLFSRLRACAGSDGLHRRNTPVVHLRIGVDGSLTEHGVDPEHDLSSGCFEDASRSTALSVSLPGRKAVRCAERCVVDPGPRRDPSRGRPRR